MSSPSQASAKLVIQEIEEENWGYADMLTDGGWLYIGHSERVSGEAKGRLRTAGITTSQTTAGSV